MIDESLLKSAVAGRDGFTWWIGRVAHPSVWYKENHALAAKGKDSHRCKVRIIGYHPWDAKDLAEEDLPWAHVMMDATTGSGQGGLGDSQALTGGETAIGFFLDGDEAQQPVIMGLLHRSSSVTNSIKETGKGELPSSQFQPFTGHSTSVRGTTPATKREIVDTATVKKNSDPDKGKILKISDSNRAVFETLGEAEISAILDGSSTQVNVTTDLQSQLRAWIVERDDAGEQSALGTEVTGGGDGSGKELSTEVRDHKQDAASAGFEHKTTKVQERPDPCNDTAIGQLTQVLTDFITMTNGLESSLDKFIDPIENKIKDMTDEINKVAQKVNSIVKGIINRIRSKILKKVLSLFSIFQGLQKKINPADWLTGPGFTKAAKGIMQILFCVFEKIIGQMLNFVKNMLKNLIANAINGPFCAAKQWVDGIFAKVFDLIGDLTGPIVNGLQWLTGGLGAITGLLGKASSLASKIFAFIGCDELKCKKPSKWASSFNKTLAVAADDWEDTLDGIGNLKGVQKNLDKFGKDAIKATDNILDKIGLGEKIKGGDTSELEDTKIDGSGLLGILATTDSLTGGDSAQDAARGLGTLESAIAGISLFGNGNSIFNACSNKMDNPQSQDDIIQMPIGFKYGRCIPPASYVDGEGDGARLKTVVGADTRIFSIEVIDGGSGYDSQTSVAIIDRTNYGRGAQAQAVVENGSIVRVVITAPGIGYCGQGTGVGIVTAISPIRPGIGYTSGDTISIFDPVNPGTATTTVPVGVTTNNGSIVDAYLPTDFNYEFDSRPTLVINTNTGVDAELVPVMLDVVQSVVDDSATRVPLIGITTVIDCPPEDHRSNK
tara:strand:+ start:141 stop:2642 length:2502 start_codon:yes stop_codon:yes gene_type:complete